MSRYSIPARRAFRASLSLAALALIPTNSTLADAASSDVVRQIRFADLAGHAYSATDLTTDKATVFLFISSQCPVSNIYAPRLAALDATYRAHGVRTIAVYSDRQEGLAEVTRNAADHQFRFPVVKDSGNKLADQLGATMTPEAIVVDSTGAVRYRGRIDDNSIATRVTSHDLQEALDAILAGKTVAKPRMLSVGCAIRRVTTSATVKPGTPTYARDIAPILRSRCEGCHRPGEVAPFSLQTYAQASAWALDIARYTANRAMPPWKPAAGYGDFLEEHDRTLTTPEIATIAKWAEAGAPEGDPKQTPVPREFTKGWLLGAPDVVLQCDTPYHVAADGDDVYRNFVVKTNFADDCYVSAVEVRPGNRAVVHHVIGYIDGGSNGKYASEALDGQDHDGQPGYTSFGGPGFVPSGMVGGWAPGMDAHLLPPGLGTFVPKGARIVIQVHYHKDGKPEVDQTRLGFHFCRGAVDKLVAGSFALNLFFKIPPGVERYEVPATMAINDDVHVLAVTPHMHLLGHEVKVWATLPDGSEKPLVWIKDWDFNWQLNYVLKEPMALPKGSKVHMLAYYDNSSSNPRNPNRSAPKSVGWGEQTTDEMCVAIVTVTHDAEHLKANAAIPRIISTTTASR